ncbi:hypothetical protein LIA77_07738 [Sarocladium implicatum]|nr:hypothetical protein LIA77_07738 [Sarocladium implicatum]
MSNIPKCIPQNVEASFKFIKWLELYKTEKPFQIFANIPDDAKDQRLSNVDFEEEPTRVTDIRGCEGDYSLDANGLAVVKHESRTSDFTNRETIENDYLPEVESLLREQLEGVDKVFVFDWRLRKSRKEVDDTYDLNDPMKILPPAEGVHVDQSTIAVIGRIERQLPEEARELLRSRRIRVVNVWRPINHCVEDMPLAVCDGSTVKPSDLVETDHVRSSYVGSTMYLLNRPQHRWYYVSRQRPDEVLLFKNFDSAGDVAAKYAPHGSFKVPELREGWKPRESIEVRALIFTK